jgi:hypothetical protein
MGYLNNLHDSKVHAMCFKIKIGICAHGFKDLAKGNTNNCGVTPVAT